MAAHINPDGLVKNRDINVLRVFRDYMLRSNMLRGVVHWDDAEYYISEINRELPKFHPDMLARDKFIGDVLTWCRSHCVSKNDVDWLDSDDKACAWFWLSRLVSGCHGIHQNYMNYFSRLYGYNELGFNLVPVPSSHKDRMSLVIEYLDRVTFDVKIRDQIIVDAKKQWLIIFNSSDLLKWVNRKDEDQCAWVWSCLRKEVVPQLHSTGWNGFGELLPMNPSEMYLFSYAIFYFWSGSAAEKELLVRKMKNAWGQKKFRKKKDGKRSINTYVDVEIGKKLDELVFHYDLTIHRTIEMLIKKEYERLKDKGI